MRYPRFRIEVRPRGLVPGGKRANDWGVPAPMQEAHDYLHNTKDAALTRCIKPVYGLKFFWAWLRIWDAKDKCTVAEWRDGRAIKAR